MKQNTTPRHSPQQGRYWQRSVAFVLRQPRGPLKIVNIRNRILP